MTIETALSQAGPVGKQRMLGLLIYYLSQACRETYRANDVDPETGVRLMSAYSEMIQACARQVLPYWGSDSSTYPDDTFLRILKDHGAKHPSLESSLACAFGKCIDASERGRR